MQDIISKLGEFLDGNALHANPAEIIAASATPFSSHAQPPLAVVFPAHINQFRQLFSLCAQTGVSLRFGGGSTSLLPPPAPPKENWILVKTARFARILDFSPENRRITLQAGVTTREINRILQPHNLALPGLSGHPMATAGGALAVNILPGDFPQTRTCASYLIDLTVLTPEAEMLTLAPHNGSSGEFSPELPLAPLFLGTGGRTGLILKATFHLRRPQATECFIIQAELPELLETAESLLNQLEDPPGLMLLDAALAEMAGYGSSPALLLKWRGSSRASREEFILVQSNAGALRDMRPLKDADFPLPHFLATSLNMQGRKKTLFVLAGLPTNARRMIAAVKAIAEKYDMELGWFGYPTLARLYFILFHKNREQWEAAVRELFALKLIFGESADIDACLGKTEEEWRREVAALSRKLQRFLDPRGLCSNWRD